METEYSHDNPDDLARSNRSRPRNYAMREQRSDNYITPDRTTDYYEYGSSTEHERSKSLSKPIKDDELLDNSSYSSDAYPLSRLSVESHMPISRNFIRRRKYSVSESRSPISSGHNLGEGSKIENNEKKPTLNDVCLDVNDTYDDHKDKFREPSSYSLYPNFELLDEWAVDQSSLRSPKMKSRKKQSAWRHQVLSEPVLINGRYRNKGHWSASDNYSERQSRFTFFSDELANTIHSPTLFELTRKDQTFKELFSTGSVWWLDVQDPTEAEMEIISQTFRLHPLTKEDIITQEVREKVELFRHYYLLSFHSFYHQTLDSIILEPLTMYIVVLRGGVLTFHFGETSHCANVRQRIRQLHDYIVVSSDWISYAIIDDITDSFQPIIASIEREVDEIDEDLLGIPNEGYFEQKAANKNKQNQSRMLRRLGECRKKVTVMLRYLSSKADVVKGFSKRCNEHWEVAPKSEIGLYLGDIQDHILTMVSNLNHYEKILSRSHSNYLADMSIEMTRVNNDTNDVVSRLTILGTIIFPMNIITGLWGMNVQVPGQEAKGLDWFYSICLSLVIFTMISIGICRYLKVI